MFTKGKYGKVFSTLNHCPKELKKDKRREKVQREKGKKREKRVKDGQAALIKLTKLQTEAVSDKSEQPGTLTRMSTVNTESLRSS